MPTHLTLLLRRILRGLTPIISLTLWQCAKENNTGPPAVPASPTNTMSYAEAQAESNALSPEEETELIEKAKGGDALSAFRLSRFYGSTKKWRLESLRWLVVSAENGDDVAAFNLGIYYQDPLPVPNYERSRHWLEIAEKRGYSRAKVELQRLEKLRKEPAPPPAALNAAPSSDSLPPEK